MKLIILFDSLILELMCIAQYFVLFSQKKNAFFKKNTHLI